MGGVVVFASVSVDGYSAGPHDELSRLHRWMDAGAADDSTAEAHREILARFGAAGAILFGRRTFDAGQEPWGEDDVFSAPVFVATHEKLDPVERNGALFTFVSGSPSDLLAPAREAAGDRDVVVMGSADVSRQLMGAGLVDELVLHLVPVLLGAGIRLLTDLPHPVELIPTRLVRGREVSLLSFAVAPAPAGGAA